jgi:dTDP-glucose pyrophosphorylase
MELDFEKYLLNVNCSGKQVLMRINEIAIPNMAIFVVDENRKLLGSITDGDLRRGLLKGISLEDNLSFFMNPNNKFLIENENNFFKVKEYKSIGVRFIPVVDSDKIIQKLIDLDKIRACIPVDAIIMAGGKGERLKPLTDNIPKPMLKIGDKPIISRNIERLINYGVKNFHISLRHFSEQIERGINESNFYDATFNFVKEDIPLGTIGSVKLIREFGNNHIILMNSDLLTNLNFEDFYQNFLDSNADMQVATIPYHIDVPYAVMEITDNQQVLSFKEKPRFTYYSNAGIYIFKKELIDLIPQNELFDATHFMEAVIANNKTICSYPILGYWLDIGRKEDYYKAQEDVNHINF